VKALLITSLMAQMREFEELNRNYEQLRCKSSCEVLSTSVSECQSMSGLVEKDIEELEEKIIQLRMVKFETNEHIETLEEELDGLDQKVRAQSDYNDHLKKKIVMKM
jgi:phage shock protein A